MDSSPRIKDLEFANEKLQKYRKDAPELPYQELTSVFVHDEVEWRMQRSGITDKGPWGIIVPYIQARAIMNRLDEALGAHNWKNQYHIHEKGVTCEISIKVNGEWVSKEDGASFTAIEEFKGGLSDAFKRAAVHWGIGRYLYEMPTTYAKFVDKKTPGVQYAKVKDKQGTEHSYYWIPDIRS